MSIEHESSEQQIAALVEAGKSLEANRAERDRLAAEIEQGEEVVADQLRGLVGETVALGGLAGFFIRDDGTRKGYTDYTDRYVDAQFPFGEYTVVGVDLQHMDVAIDNSDRNLPVKPCIRISSIFFTDLESQD